MNSFIYYIQPFNKFYHRFSTWQALFISASLMAQQLKNLPAMQET